MEEATGSDPMRYEFRKEASNAVLEDTTIPVRVQIEGGLFGPEVAVVLVLVPVGSSVAITPAATTAATATHQLDVAITGMAIVRERAARERGRKVS